LATSETPDVSKRQEQAAGGSLQEEQLPFLTALRESRLEQAKLREELEKVRAQLLARPSAQTVQEEQPDKEELAAMEGLKREAAALREELAAWKSEASARLSASVAVRDEEDVDIDATMPEDKSGTEDTAANEEADDDDGAEDAAN
jgi:hypothetical protein